MRKKIDWWWVVATHESRRMCSEEWNALEMTDYADKHAAAKLFPSLGYAKAWVKKMKRLNFVQEKIQLQIISDESWEFSLEMYHKGMEYGLWILS